MKAPLQKLNVLVCEYKPSNRAVLQRILEKEGHSVTMAPSLMEALAVFDKNPEDTFNLMLVDVIPTENGMEWVSEVRKKQPRMMFLAVSAYLGDGFLPPDCGLYLPKPFTSQHLTDAVAELIVGRTTAVIRQHRIKYPSAA
jgi:DNA-binding response OmpR family regulator